MKPPPTLTRLILIAALVGMSGASAKASLVTLAATGEAAPGGGTFGTHFGVPVINAAGQVAFTAFTSHVTDTDTGVYQGTSSSDLAAVARIGGGLTSVGRGVAENAGGVVVFNANGGTAILGHIPNAPGPYFVASAGDVFQPIGGGPIYTFSSFGDPLINDLGRVAYLASGVGAAFFDGGVVVAYAGQGDQLNGQLVGFGGPIAIDNAGNAAFFGTIQYQGTDKFAIATSNTANSIISPSVFSGDDVGGRTLLFDSSSMILGPAGIAILGELCNGVTCEGDVFLLQGSTLRTIAKTGDPAPGGGTFSTSVNGSATFVFDAPHMNDAGSIVFVGWTDGGPGHGIYRYTQAHGLEAMALEGHPPYAAAAGFRNAVINNHDVVAFQSYDGSAGNRRGVYLTDGTTTLRAGSDNFFGAEGSSTGAYSRAFFGSQIQGQSPLNDRAQVTFVNSSGFTSQSVLKFSVDPKWVHPGGGAWDTADNWTFSVAPVSDSIVAIAGQAAGPLVVTGPAAATTVASVEVGVFGQDLAELDLQSGGPLTCTGRFLVDYNGALGGIGTLTASEIDIENGGNSPLNGMVTGKLTLNGPLFNLGIMDGDFIFNGDVTNEVGALIKGNQTFNGTVTNLGTISPGHSPGTDTVNGDLTLQSMTDQGVLTGSLLEIQIGGPNAGTDYDVIDVTGHLTLAGTLHVALIDGFTPSPGQKFHILNAASTSGTFDAITGANVTVTADGIDVEPTSSATSTTTTLPGGTTTTTLPISPCADRTGFDGVQCVCAGGLPLAACTGDRVPAAVGKLFTRGCTLMQRAAGLVTPKKLKKVVHSAGATFAKDIARVTKAAKARKHPLSQACGASLAGTLGDAKQRADQISSTL